MESRDRSGEAARTREPQGEQEIAPNDRANSASDDTEKDPKPNVNPRADIDAGGIQLAFADWTSRS
jgi:hypothetical protein